VTKRRVGCLSFGLGWAAVFVLTNIGMALGDPEPGARNPLATAFWIQIAVFVAGAVLFYRAEMKDSEF
jgi:hypothetical protein